MNVFRQKKVVPIYCLVNFASCLLFSVSLSCLQQRSTALRKVLLMD